MLLTTPVLAAVLERRIVFVGGKGGVGKTTIAAALAVEASRRGRRVLVVSTDPAHSLGDVFTAAVGGTERKLAERLWGLEIDAAEEAGQHIEAVKHQMKGLVHPRMYGEVDRQLDLARLAPGTEEAALLERMAEIMGDASQRFDAVVFDTAPTGHTLRLLSLPEIMTAWTDGLLRHRERSSKFGAILARLGGTTPQGDEQSLIGTPSDYPEDTRAARLYELLLARQRKLRRARELLLDHETTGFVLVLNPDKLSLLEARKAVESLERVQIPVSAVVVNRVMPTDAGGEFLEARRRQEAPYLEEISRAFSRLPRVLLPLLPGDVHGVEALGQIGRLLTS